MAGILAIFSQLLPLVTSTISRIIAERGAAQGKSDGEILRETEAMIPQTAQMHLNTIAKALAKKAQLEGVTAARAVKGKAAEAPQLTALQQVDRMIELLTEARGQLLK
jgi:hypothetical protein